MTYYDFTTALMGAIGIAHPRRSLCPNEACSLLRRLGGLDEQLEDMKKDFGKLVPLIRLVRPLATWFVTRSSAYLKDNRPFACRLIGQAKA
jgi:hypothetical protein